MRRLFLDMDGVLCDFCQAIADHFRMPMGRWPAGEYDLEVVFKIERKHIVQVCDAAFFEGLAWHDDGRRLVDAIWKDGLWDPFQTAVLTNVCDGWAGKVAWLKREMPSWWTGRRVITAADKAWLARPGDVLVDDCDDHINAWRLAGGVGVLVPRRWNSGWDDERGMDGVIERLAELKE